MILYQPTQNRSWKPLRGKALRWLIFNTSAVERQRFERKRFDPIPPPFPYPGKGGGSAGLSPVAAPPIAQPGLPVKGKAAAARRCSAPLTGCPGCATSQGATGDISSRAAVDGTGKIGGSASGHSDQRTGKNTAPFFNGSGALCKVDSPFSLVCLCMLLLRKDRFPV